MIFPALLAGFLIVSCKKDKDSAEKFSTQTVEQNKALVEESGIDFVDAMKRMESLETADVLVNFGDIFSSASSKGSIFTGDSKLFSTFDAVLAATRGKGSLNNVFDAMISPEELGAEAPESIETFWNESVGTYTWNSVNNCWDENPGGAVIKFLFPSTETSLTNDASFTISEYTGVTISNPLDEEYTGDLPASLNAELKVGTETLITYVFGASYNNDGVPNAVASDLTIETFKFEIDLTNTSQVVSVNYKFLENNITIMDLGAEGTGLFTEANVDNHTTTHTETNYYSEWVFNQNTQQYEEVLVPYTNEWKETEFEEVINSVNAHFQLFNVAIKGELDIKGMVDQFNLIDEELENEDIDGEEADTKYTEQINKFLNLRLVNVTNNEILAKAQAYVAHESDYYGEYSYVDFRLTFGDGSPIAMETYFDQGFDDFVSEVNSLINDINSDYDTGMDPLEY